jgi:NAD+ kinase
VFRGGLGLAFNNSTEPIDHLVLPEEARIRVRITRGPALVTADNNPFSLPLEEGDEVLIERHSEEAILLGLGVQEHR